MYLNLFDLFIYLIHEKQKFYFPHLIYFTIIINGVEFILAGLFCQYIIIYLYFTHCQLELLRF